MTFSIVWLDFNMMGCLFLFEISIFVSSPFSTASAAFDRKDTFSRLDLLGKPIKFSFIFVLF